MRLAGIASRGRRRLERWGRGVLVALTGLLRGGVRRPVVLGPRPRILVVRLDERVGNLVLVTPLIASLRARFPGAEIELLAHHRNRALLGAHPDLSRYLSFDKRAFFAREGPLAAPFVLRRRRFDLALDAANPTDPSTTQALLVLLSGARHTVGHAAGGFGRLYSSPVVATSAGAHEIDLRLALLDPLPGTVRVRATSLAPLPVRAAPRAAFGVVNVGARLDDKRLGAAAYAALARTLIERGLACLLTYGPGERGLAADVATRAPGAELAPPTTLVELAATMRDAALVVTCDTGPMHVAVAVGTPTCGLFVSTEPARYGYVEPPHAAVDTRDRPVATWLPEVARWVATLVRAPARGQDSR